MSVINFLKKDIFSKGVFRYFFIVLIFFSASFYSLNMTKEEVKDTKKDDQDHQEERVADLDRDAFEKVYPGKLDSQAEDHYRVIVRAEANEDALVDVYIRSFLGMEKKVGEVMIRGGLSSMYEQVFTTDDMYRDIILRRPEKMVSGDDSWDGAKVYISDVSVTRLNVISRLATTWLKPTIFGNTQVVLRQLPAAFPGKVDRSLISGSQNIGEYFESEASAISSVYAKFSAIGNGGVGRYDIEILEYDANGSGKAKMVAKESFEEDKLWKYADDEHKGLYRFDIPVALNKEKLYFVGFSSKNVVSDVENGLELVRFGEDEDGEGGGFIALGMVQYTGVGSGKSAARILSGATIQDIGSAYLYEYRMSHTKEDLLDVRAIQGGAKYDEKLGMITQSEADGAAFEYRIDTVYPFEKMSISAVGLEGVKRGGFQIEYSYDGKSWRKVLPEDDNETEQRADFIIDGQGSVATVYVRIAHYGKSQKDDILGLSDFRVSALLKK